MNSKLFKISKKIFSWGIVLLVLFSIVNSNIALAEDNWWYGTNDGYVGPMSQAECNLTVNNADSGLLDIDVTAVCFQSNTNPNQQTGGGPSSCTPPQVWSYPANACVNPPDAGADLTNPFNENNLLVDSNGNVIGTPTPGQPGYGIENVDGSYKLLAPLSDKLTVFDPTEKCSFTKYLNLMINIFIVICAILAMIMIVLGGIEYMTSELVSSKEAGKGQMTNAIFGLLLALAAWLILHEVNPNLLNLCINSQLPDAQVTIVEGDESSAPFAAISQTAIDKFNIYCPGSGGVGSLEQIARSFQGKVTYSQAKRGTYDNNTMYLDCSSFVKQVYECAGISIPGGSTSTMFPGTETVGARTSTSANGVDLEPGDILGWMAGEGGEAHGHAFMYLGNGLVIEVTSGGGTTGTNGAVLIRNMPYLNRFHHIIRVNEL